MSETHVVEKMETDLNTTNQSADSGEILTLITDKVIRVSKRYKIAEFSYSIYPQVSHLSAIVYLIETR